MFGYKLSPFVIAAVWAASIAATWALARSPGAQAAPPAAPPQAATAAPKLPKIDLEKGEALRRKFDSLLADARLLDKRTPVQRLEQVKATHALRAESDALFGDALGPYGQCAQAGMAQQELMGQLVESVLALEAGRPISMIAIGNLAHTGYSLGDKSGACRELLNNESLGRP